MVVCSDRSEQKDLLYYVKSANQILKTLSPLLLDFSHGSSGHQVVGNMQAYAHPLFTLGAPLTFVTMMQHPDIVMMVQCSKIIAKLFQARG
jgi:hypothetical protein